MIDDEEHIKALNDCKDHMLNLKTNKILKNVVMLETLFDLQDHFTQATNVKMSRSWITMTLLIYGYPLVFWCLFSLILCLIILGTGADPGFNATTAHQQNPNYHPFRKHLQNR
jgi:hypothetical protein